MAIGAADGSVVIRTDIDTTGITKGRKKIERDLSGLKTALRGVATAVGTAFGIRQIVAFGAASVRETEKLTNAMIGLKSVIDGMGRSYKTATDFINEYTKDGLLSVTEAASAYKNLTLRGYTDEQTRSVLLALKDSAAFGRQSSYTLGGAIQTAAEGLKNENSLMVDNAGVTKNVARMWDTYATTIGTTASKLTQAQKIQAEVNGILHETRFQTGDAAKISATYSGQVLRLQASFVALKNAVGGILTPILQQMLPGISATIEGLTKIATLVSKIMYEVFGIQAATATTTINATADAQEGLAEATDKATAAAKKQLASFDELNIIGEDKTAGGGAGAAGIGGGIVADAQTVIEGITQDVELPGWATKLRGFFEYIKELGEGPFGENINAFLKGFWDALKPVVTAILDAVVWAVGALIGLVAGADADDMEGVGKALGSIVGALLLFLGGLAVAGIIGGISKAVGGLLALAAAHPVLAVAVALTALALAVAAFGNAEFDDSSLGRRIKAIEDLIAKADALNKSTKTFLDAQKENRAGLKDTYSALEILAGKYFDLAEKTELNNDEQALMRAYAAGLIKELPELASQIDLTTGAYNGTREELMQVIQRTKEYYLVRATEESLIEIAKRQIAVQRTLRELEQQKLAIEDDLEQARIIASRGNLERVAEYVLLEAQMQKIDKATAEATETQEGLTKEWDYATGFIQDFATATTTEMQAVNDAVEGSGSKIDDLKKTVKDAIDDISDRFTKDKKAKNAVQTWLDTLSSAVEKFKMPGVNMNAVVRKAEEYLNLPQYATGTVVPPNAAHLAIIGDNKYERELVSPESLMRQIVREEAGGGAGDKDININLTTTLDGEKIAKSTIKIHNGLVRQTGTSPLMV